MSLTILIHSSKTMRARNKSPHMTTPLLVDRALPLAGYIQSLPNDVLQQTMQISKELAEKVHATLQAWNANPKEQSMALDSFVGDIYSGLQVATLSAGDRDYAQRTLRILSGLYGILRPNDGVRPYRLEMGYKLPEPPYNNLYTYWGRDIVETLPKDGLIINLSAAEYTRTVLPYVDAARVVAPRFLTVNPKTGKPGQVIVHTKIARGAFARWLIVNRINRADDLIQFSDLNYHYDASLSTPAEPTFVCETFGGIGLSVRLKK